MYIQIYIYIYTYMYIYTSSDAATISMLIALADFSHVKGDRSRGRLGRRFMKCGEETQCPTPPFTPRTFDEYVQQH